MFRDLSTELFQGTGDETSVTLLVPPITHSTKGTQMPHCDTEITQEMTNYHEQRIADNRV